MERSDAAATAGTPATGGGEVGPSPPPTAVQKLKLQLFHRLQRRHRDAWKRYWTAFQLYLAARLSLEEFHALAEELLGPDKHLHNKFVVALLSTAYQQPEGDGGERRSHRPQPPPERQDHNGEGGGRAAKTDPLLQIIREESARHDSEQRSHVEQDLQASARRKRPHSSIVTGSTSPDENAVHKLLHLAGGGQNVPHADDHPDHQSAKLLIGLGSYATTISPSSTALTPRSTSVSKGFESQSSAATDSRRS